MLFLSEVATHPFVINSILKGINALRYGLWMQAQLSYLCGNLLQKFENKFTCRFFTILNFFYQEIILLAGFLKIDIMHVLKLFFRTIVTYCMYAFIKYWSQVVCITFSVGSGQNVEIGRQVAELLCEWLTSFTTVSCKAIGTLAVKPDDSFQAGSTIQTGIRLALAHFCEGNVSSEKDMYGHYQHRIHYELVYRACHWWGNNLGQDNLHWQMRCAKWTNPYNKCILFKCDNLRQK
jgi:hypothetical protein